MRGMVVAVVLLWACGDDDAGGVRRDSGSDDPRFQLDISGRPAVHGVASVIVTIAFDGAMRSDEFPTTLPATLHISPLTQGSEWTLSVEARDANGLAVGYAAKSVAAGASTESIQLDPTDFVVNTVFADDQFLTTDYEAVGLQLAATQTGWVAGLRAECTSCDIYARRFASDGTPLGSTLVATSMPTTNASQPAVVAVGVTTLVFWDFTNPSNGNRGIACRAIVADGTLSAAQVTVTTDPGDVIAGAALPTGNVVLTWQQFETSANVVRTAIVQPDCTLVGSAQTVSQAPSGTAASRAHVAANANRIFYAWVSADELHIRKSTHAGSFSVVDVPAGFNTSGYTVEHVRVVPFGAGFAMVLRYATTTADGPGKLTLVLLDESANPAGSPVLISDQSASDLASNKAFGLATRPSDGALLVAWHVCISPGVCDVYAQRVLAGGALDGTPFIVPFNTTSDQINPSVIGIGDAFVVAWTDSTGVAPDQSGTAVRARYIY